MDSLKSMLLKEKHELRNDFERFPCLRGSWCCKGSKSSSTLEVLSNTLMIKHSSSKHSSHRSNSDSAFLLSTDVPHPPHTLYGHVILLMYLVNPHPIITYLIPINETFLFDIREAK